MVQTTYDLVLVGTGFASAFFLERFLAMSGPRVRVLVLERGAFRDHREYLERQDVLAAESSASFHNLTPAKPWVFHLGVGGGSNCWWACTPRMLPEDFRLRTLYGVGRDWPLGYDDLEPFYGQAERMMSVSGPEGASPYPRSSPYPLPPHRFSDPDRLFKTRFPDQFFAQPTARPSRTLPSGRSRCCASGVCSRCPIDSKFTILNGLSGILEDARVTLIPGGEAVGVEVAGNVASGVRYRQGDVERLARGEIVALGANALFNPFLLLRSGLHGGRPGEGLVEQVSVRVRVLLDGVNGFQGSSSITGLGYMLYPGIRRRERAAALMETWNVPRLRLERGRWQECLDLKFIYEDLPQSRNRVFISKDDPTRPAVEFHGFSDYAGRAMAALPEELGGVLEPVPVESYHVQSTPGPTESHILGTAPMASDPEAGVVDSGQVHHQVRNLLVLGGSSFPSAAPANPTLTICALSLRSAELLLSRGAA